MLKLTKIFENLLKESLNHEDLRLKFNDNDRLNNSGANTMYMGDEPIVEFGVAQTGEIVVYDITIPNAIFLRGGFESAKEGKGYGSLAIKFMFEKLPKIQNLILQCYESACPFWIAMNGKVIHINHKINIRNPVKTIVINRNDFMNGYGLKINIKKNDKNIFYI